MEEIKQWLELFGVTPTMLLAFVVSTVTSYVLTQFVKNYILPVVNPKALRDARVHELAVMSFAATVGFVSYVLMIHEWNDPAMYALALLSGFAAPYTWKVAMQWLKQKKPSWHAKINHK